MRVKLRPQVDIGLRAPQRGEIFLDVIQAGILGHHRGHHEAGVQHLSETKLLHEIVRAAEQANRRHVAVDQMLHPAEQQAIRIGQLISSADRNGSSA